MTTTVKIQLAHTNFGGVRVESVNQSDGKAYKTTDLIKEGDSTEHYVTTSADIKITELPLPAKE